MKKWLKFSSFLFVFILIGCQASLAKNSSDEMNNRKSEEKQKRQVSAETVEGDFIFRLISEKDTYKEGEPVSIYAELEYIGDKESVTIFHASTPFIISIYEKTRGYSIDGVVNTILLSTTLQKGEVYREDYHKSGGISDQESKDYMAFAKNFFEQEGFPLGEYEIKGSAAFSFVDNEGEKTHISIPAKISFSVTK